MMHNKALVCVGSQNGSFRAFCTMAFWIVSKRCSIKSNDEQKSPVTFSGPSSVESQVKQNCCKVSIHHERKTKHPNKLCSAHAALNAA